MTYPGGPTAAEKALRQAQLYGYLIEKHGRLYHPGSGRPLCGVRATKEIVRSGCLALRSGRYELTPEGLRQATSILVGGNETA